MSSTMTGRTCYHCKAWIEDGASHDCWTTTEAALTADLTDDLREAWERLRDAAVALGDQRIYASHSSIMFARQSCYCFVRPKRSFLELNVFLGRTISSPQVRRTQQASAAKTMHVIQIRHRDEVEPPVTDWMKEAYHFEPTKSGKITTTAKSAKTAKTTKAANAKRGRTAKALGRTTRKA